METDTRNAASAVSDAPAPTLQAATEKAENDTQHCGANGDLNHTHTIYLDVGDDLFPILRRAVEDGWPDYPVHVYRRDRLSLTIKSLYRAALLDVEDGSRGCRFVAWNPHPRAEVGPRVRALLEQRAEARAKKEAG